MKTCRTKIRGTASCRWKRRRTSTRFVLTDRWSRPLENAGTTMAVRRRSSQSWCRAEPVGRFSSSPRNASSTPWVSRTWNGAATERASPGPRRGLRLRPRDLAKIRQLVLQRGQWGEQQIVPVAWLQEATSPHVQADQFRRYGYLWWLGDASFGDAQTPWVAGFGKGGQRLFIVPDLELVVVVTAGNYNDPEQRRLPTAVLSQFVLPALVGAPRD